MYEALFNLVNVWSLMLWPLMLADPKGVKVKNKAVIYGGTQVHGLPLLCAVLQFDDNCCQLLHCCV